MSTTNGERLEALNREWSPSHGNSFTAQAAARGLSLAQVAARAGVSTHAAESLGRGRRPTDRNAFAALVREVGYDPSSTASDLSEVCTQWSDEHAQALALAIKAAGHPRLEDFAVATGISKMSLWRWTTNRVRPRPASLAPLLEALGTDASLFSGANGTRVGEDKNRFALELSTLLRENGLSVQRAAQVLDVNASALAGWLEGRALPRDPAVRARLESAVGVTVEEVRASVELAATSTEGLTGLSKLLVSKRLELGLTRKAFAEKVEASEDTVRGWELDSMTPPHSYLRAIANVLDVPRREVAESLFGELPARDFHERLRRARKHQLLTTNEVANALGMKSQHAYTRYEVGPDGGRSTSFPGTSSRLEAITAVLGVSTDDLFEPDRGVFAAWLAGALATATTDQVVKAASATGTKVADFAAWTTGTKRPDVRTAELLGMALGTGKVVARAALTGERVL